jgi:hypothetical protein
LKGLARANFKNSAINMTFTPIIFSKAKLNEKTKQLEWNEWLKHHYFDDEGVVREKKKR